MRDWVACWHLTLIKAFVAGGCALAVAALAPTESRAQSKSGAAPTPTAFEVATVKPSKPGDTGSSLLRDASSKLAQALTRRLDRTVADLTGLTGDYDFTLEWTPDETQGPRPTEISDRQPGTSELGPSIFTALQEQLGLKLVAGRGPVEVLIIASAERPSAN
jgi:hypothetical protein